MKVLLIFLFVIAISSARSTWRQRAKEKGYTCKIRRQFKYKCKFRNPSKCDPWMPDCPYSIRINTLCTDYLCKVSKINRKDLIFEFNFNDFFRMQPINYMGILLNG